MELILHVRNNNTGELFTIPAQSDEELMLEEILENLGPAPDPESTPEGDYCEFEVLEVEGLSDIVHPHYRTPGECITKPERLPTLLELAELVCFYEEAQDEDVAQAALAYQGDLDYARSMLEEYVGYFESKREISEYVLDNYYDAEPFLKSNLGSYFDHERFADDLDQDFIITDGGLNVRGYYVFHNC